MNNETTITHDRPALFEHRRSLFAVMGACLAVALMAATGCQRSGPSKDESVAASGVELAAEGEPAVELVINYGDGVEKRFTRIPHEDGMTVLGALQFVARHPRGILFEKQGAGTAALLTTIDDLSNQTGPAGKNWLYRVNGNLATKSFDAYALSPGDVIVWRFEEYE